MIKKKIKKSGIFSGDDLFALSIFLFAVSYILFYLIRLFIRNYDCFNISDNIIIKYSIVLGIFLSFGLLLLISKYDSRVCAADLFTTSGIFGFILIFIGFSFFSNSLIRLVNTFDFYSEVKVVKEIVSGSDTKVSTIKSKKYGERSITFYYLKIENKNKLFKSNKIEVDFGEHRNAYFGDEIILKVKPGFLRFPRKSGKYEIKYNYEYEKEVNKRDRELLLKLKEEQAKRKKRR